MFILYRQQFLFQIRSCAYLLSPLSSLRDVEATHAFPNLDYIPPSTDQVPNENLKQTSSRHRVNKGLLPMKARGSKWTLYSDSNFPNPISPFAFIDFKRLEDPVRILNVLDNSRNYLQLRQIVAALTRLRELGQSISRKMLHFVMDLAKDRINSSKMEDCVGMFLIASRMKLLSHHEFLNGLAKISMERRYPSQMSIRELATLIHSCGFLIRLQNKRKPQFRNLDHIEDSRLTGYEPDRPHGLMQVEELMEVALEEFAIFRKLDSEFELRLPSIVTSVAYFGKDDFRMMELLKRVSESMTRIEENQIASIVFAFANSRIEKRQIVEKLALQVTKPERLVAFQTNQLIALVSAFSRLRFENYGVWYALFLELSQKLRLHEMKIADIQMLLRSMISTRMTDSTELVHAFVQEFLTPDKMDSMDSHQLKDLLILISGLPDMKSIDGNHLVNKIETDLNLEKMSNEDFVLMIKGYARFRIDQSSNIANLVSKACQISRLSELNVNGAVSLLHSFVKMDWNDSEPLQPLLKQCFTPNQIVNIHSNNQSLLIEVIGRLRFNPGASLRILLSKIQQSGECYSVHRMVSCLFHLSMIPGVKSEYVELLIDEFFCRSGRLTLKPCDAGMLVRALGDLRIYHPGIMDQIRRCIKVQREAFSHREILNCLIGLSKLLYKESQTIGLLLTQSKHVLEFSSFSTRDLLTVLHCLVSLKIELVDCEDIIQEMTLWTRMQELEVHQLLDLLLCIKKVDEIIAIKDKTSIVRLCDFFQQDQKLILLTGDELQDLSLCFHDWKIEHSLVNKIRTLSNGATCSNRSGQREGISRPLVVIDSKDMTASLAERLLDGR
eukprot:g7480.t1